MHDTFEIFENMGGIVLERFWLHPREDHHEVGTTRNPKTSKERLHDVDNVFVVDAVSQADKKSNLTIMALS